MNSRNLTSIIWLWFGIAFFWGVENIYINMYFIDPEVIPKAEQQAIYISYMVAFSAISNVVAIWLSGAATDACKNRMGRRKPFILIGGILGGMFMCMFPLVRLLPTTVDKVVLALILDCSLSFSGDFTTGSRMALLTDLTEEKNRAKTNGILNVPNMLGMAIPIVLAEFVRLNLGVDSFFYVGGGVMVVACVTSVFFIQEPAYDANQLKSFKECIKRSFTWINYNNNKPFYHALVGVALLSLGGNIYYPFIFPYIRDYMGFNGDMYTIIAGSVLLINIVVQIPLGVISDKRGRKAVYKVILPVDVAFLIIFYFVGPGNVAGALLIGGPAITFYFSLKIIMMSWMQDLCPENQRGSLLVYSNIADVLMMAPGAFIGGALIDYFTLGTGALFHPIMFLASAIVVATSFLILHRIPDTIKKIEEKAIKIA